MAIHKEALIAQRAYEIWEQSGRPHGLDRDHWYQASAEIEPKTAINGDAPVHAAPGSVLNGDAPVHGPTPAAKPPKAATTAPAKVKAKAAPAETKTVTLAAKAKAPPKKTATKPEKG